MALPPVVQGNIGSLLRFKITFDEVLGVLTFEDQSQATYDSQGFTDVKGVLWITHSTQGLIYVNSGYNTNVFTSPDTSDGSRTKNITLSGVAKGTYTVNYKVSHGNGTSTSSKSYVFNSIAPAISITKSVNYDISTLTINDTSSYQIGIGERSPQEALLPSTITRYIKVRPPLGSAMETFENEDAPQVTTIGPPIYTTNYDLEVATTLVYQLEKWDNNYWVEWKLVKTHYDSFNVEFTDSCISSCIACIYQLSEKLVAARGRSQREADYYERLVYDISFYYGLYMMYKQANMDTGYACEKIKAILRRECNIDIAPSTTPVEIVPLYNIGGTSVPGADGSKWHSGDGVPGSLGVNGDFYLQTSNGYVYKKEGGSWGVIMILAVKGKRIIKTVTSSYAMSLVDDMIFVRSASTPITITLPDASEGDSYTIVAERMVSSISVLPQRGDIENLSVFSFGTEGDSINLVLKSSNWKII